MPYKGTQRISELKQILARLIDGYSDATGLINDQMQAVIYSDLVLLNELIPEQVARFEELQELEEEFKQQLNRIFKDTRSDTPRTQTLTGLMESLEEPSGELNRLRERLSEQVEKSRNLRAQLMDLLHFAREHNAEQFRMITSLGDDQAGMYDAKGRRRTPSAGSVAINQKA